MKTHSIRTILLAFIILIIFSFISGCWSTNEISVYPRLQYGAEGSDTSLLVIQDENGNYGYGDAAGKVVISPRYDDARPFYDGLAAVKRGKRYGYIDKKGRTVIPFRYYQALDFHNGKAIVGTEPGQAGEMCYTLNLKCSIIDIQGKIIQDIPYTRFGNYSDGMLIAYTDDEAFFLDQYYNQSDIMRRGMKADQLFDFHEGFTMFQALDNLYYYKDKYEFILPKGFAEARPFSGGFASVMPDKETGMWGYIDKTENIMIPAQFKDACSFGEGLACVFTKENKWAIIDTSGREVCKVDEQLSSIGSFNEGLCAVAKTHKMDGGYKEGDQNTWGFMDSSGKIAIDIQFEKVTPFKNGIAQVLIDGKIAYIDKAGKYIWGPR